MDEHKINVHTPKGSGQLSSSLKERLKKCGRYYSPTALKKVNNSLDLSQPSTPDTTAAAFPRSSLTCSTPNSGGSPLHNESTSVKCYPSLQLTPISSKFDRRQLQESSPFLTPVCRKKNFYGRQVDLDTPKAKRTCLAPASSEISVASSRHESECLGATVTPLDNGCDVSGDDLGEGNNKANEKLAVDNLSMEDKKDKDNCLNDSDVKLAVINVNCKGSRLDLQRRKSQMEKLLKEKLEHLRKLNMVKMYRSKDEFVNLDELILKWTQVSQQVLVDLHAKIPEPRPTLTEFITHLNIDFDFIKFNPENETF